MKYILIALLFCICWGCNDKSSEYLSDEEVSKLLRDSQLELLLISLRADSAIASWELKRLHDPDNNAITASAWTKIKDTIPTKPLNIKMKPRWRDSVEHDTIYLAPLHDPNTFNNSGWLSTGGYDTFLHKVDSIKSKWTDASKATRPTVFTITPNQDTIRCILLCCDTSSQNGYRTQRCYWMYGWEISELWMIFNEGEPAYKPIGYLDDKKVPLSKNLVVWISKELK